MLAALGQQALTLFLAQLRRLRVGAGQRQVVRAGHGDQGYISGGVVPMSVFSRTDRRYPMLRYPWVDARAALVSMA